MYAMSGIFSLGFLLPGKSCSLHNILTIASIFYSDFEPVSNEYLVMQNISSNVKLCATYAILLFCYI